VGQLIRALKAPRSRAAKSARRSIVTYAALVVRAEIAGADAAAVRQSADRVPVLQRHALSRDQMLEGFVPREPDQSSARVRTVTLRFKMLMDGTIDAPR